MNESVVNRQGPLLDFRIIEHGPDESELYSVDLASGVKELVFDEIIDMIIDYLSKDKRSTRPLRIAGKLIVNADMGYVTGIWAMQISPTSRGVTGQAAIKIDLGSEQRITEKNPIIDVQTTTEIQIRRLTNHLVRDIQKSIFWKCDEILTHMSTGI